MPTPNRTLTWGQVYEGAQRLDMRHGTEAYTYAVLMRMLARVGKPDRPRKTYFLVRRPRAPLTPLQEYMAWRRKMAST